MRSGLDKDAVKRANPVEHLIPALLNEMPIEAGGELKVRCPWHEDKRPSLRIHAEKGVWHCDPCGLGGDGIAFVQKLHGCDFPTALAFLADLGGVRADRSSQATERRREVAAYDYRDESGALLFQSVRFEPKDFRQRRPDESGGWSWSLNGTRRVVYRYPELKGRKGVLILEGEKDVDRAWTLNLPATCNAGGAGKWLDEHTRQLAASGIERVVIVPDNDDPGRKHAEQIARSCHAAGLQVRVLNLPDVPSKGDLSDYFDAHTKADFVALAQAAALYAPSDANVTAQESDAAIVLADVLRDLAAFIGKYVVLTAEQSTAVVLWVLHTHMVDAADCTPYLQITSATKRAGKTRLLEVLEHVVARPWFTGRTSAAALVRKVDADRPTLLLDESDAAFNGEKEYAEALRGILNTGYRRSGRVTLCVGQGANLTFKDFVTFGPKAIAGIGALPDTIADRAITIKLRRKTTDEPCARWRERDGRTEAALLFQMCKRWATPSTVATLKAARPSLPAGLGDRQADVWEPLLAIADAAGADWPDAARQAARAIVGSAEDTDITVELLRDIADHVIDDQGFISTKDLLAKLTAIDDRPWASWRHDKPITARGIAKLLGPLGIHPTATNKLRGYRRDAFADAIARYLPFYPSMCHYPNEIGPKTPFPSVTSQVQSDALQASQRPENIDVVTHRHIERRIEGFNGLTPRDNEAERGEF